MCTNIGTFLECNTCIEGNFLCEKGKSGIEKDVFPLLIPDDVKTLACNIFINMKLGNPRRINRKQAVCFCIYQSYLDLDVPVDITQIGKIINLGSSDSRGSITKFLKYLEQNQNAHHSGYVNTEQMLKYYCSSSCFDFNDDIKIKIIELWKKIKKLEPSMKNKKPRNTAAGIIWYYTSSINLIGDIKEYSEAFSLKQSSLRTTVLEISSIIEG